MNIPSTSNSIATIGAVSALQPQQAGSVADPDAGGTQRPHRMHGGGHMRAAVSQALQSLGLSAPQDATGSSAASSASGSAGDSSSTAASGIQQDMQQFMHSLFEAVKSQSASSSSTSASSGSGVSGSSFADGLSTLISQVSSGSAPSDLQGAFSKLASDLQAAGATRGTGAAGPTSSVDATQATLQAFLTNLQQDLGYGSSTASTIGNLVTAQV